MSSGKFSDKRELLSYRAIFKDRWRAFIRANFQSAEHAAVCFGVDGSTAKKWWEGSHAPSGYVVSIAYEREPEAAHAYLRASQ
jgi:hypothetical protein